MSAPDQQLDTFEQAALARAERTIRRGGRKILSDAEAQQLAECEAVIAQHFGPPGSRERRHGVKQSDRRAHDVYVHLAADGTVLYVGISLQTLARTGAHRASSAWWLDVATIRVEHLPDRTSALHREAELIAELQPKHNREVTP